MKTSRRRVPIVMAVMMIAVLWSISGGPYAAAHGAQLTVAVTIPPQADLVERIGGDRVQVELVVPPGQDPHTFSPTPRQVMSLGRATLYFRIGLPLEDQLLPRLTGRRQTMTVVETTAGIRQRTFAADEGHTCDGHHHHHGHGHHCQAHAGQPDPHVWLAPGLLSHQAERICDALCEADPAAATFYRSNLRALQTRLDEVEAEITEKLAPYRGRAFYVFHPAFGYFADAWGLRQIAVEVEGKTPSPRQLRALIAQARDDEVKVIFVQPQFDQRSAESVATAIGGSVVAMDPLRRDVIDNLLEIAAHLQRGFER